MGNTVHSPTKLKKKTYNKGWKNVNLIQYNSLSGDFTWKA